MTVYLVSAIASFGLSLLLTPLIARWAKKRQFFLPPIRERDAHTEPTPRVGGIAIVLTFLIVLFGWILYAPDRLSFTGLTVAGLDKNLVGLILSVVLLSAVNAVDDYKSLRWPIRLAVQILATLLVVAFGIGIDHLSNPFGGQISLAGWGALFVVVWLVGLTNVVNWADGVDGLASGVSAIALATIFFLSISPAVAQSENALVAAIVFGAVLGFMPYNFLSPRVFLGDTGSMFLGFIIGVLSIISGGKIATAFLVLAVPFLDAVTVALSRIFHGQSPFLPDQRHLHHRLLKLGMKPWQIVGLFYTISLLFGLIALNTQTIGKLQAAAAALVLMVLFIAVYSLAGYFEKRT